LEIGIKQEGECKHQRPPISCNTPWCNGLSKKPGDRNMGNTAMGLAGDQVLAIAQAEAARVYRDLSAYRIQLALEDDGWHVDYEFKNPRLKGGGPHYVIDAHTGAVLSKRYEQ
jgi:hypothetical protein